MPELRHGANWQDSSIILKFHMLRNMCESFVLSATNTGTHAADLYVYKYKTNDIRNISLVPNTNLIRTCT